MTPAERDNKKRINLKVPEWVHHTLRVLAVAKRTTLQDLLEKEITRMAAESEYAEIPADYKQSLQPPTKRLL